MPRHKPWFLALLSVWILAFAPFAHAQALEEEQDLDVRLVIDVSGSMKRNDPANLRQPSIDLLLQLLPDEANAGVWTFGRWVNMLVKHQQIDPQWKRMAQSQVGEINSVGLFTNIGEALEKAAYDWQATDPAQEKNIILLTDGMVDVDKDPEVNRQEWRRIVDEVLPRLKAAGYRIHTIALSDNADTDLMNRLSLETDGVSGVAHTAEELMKVFLQAFDASAPAEEVPLSDNSFIIDSSVEEFTALIFRNDGSGSTELISPDQQRLTASTRSSDLNWYKTDRYDLITVKRPGEGEWGVNADMAPDSRITVVSNLNLRLSSIKSNLLVGSQPDFSFVLQEDGNTITNPDFLSLMHIEASLQGGKVNGEMHELWRKVVSDDGVPAAGMYKGQLPPLRKPGVYELSLSVDGKTFKRELHRQISVREAFSADIREEFSDGKQQYVLTVIANQSDIDYAQSFVVASIRNPLKNAVVKPLESSGLDSWRVVFEPTIEGPYTVDIQAKGQMLDGSSFEQQLSPIEFNFSMEGGVVESQEPFVEHEPEPAPTPTPTPAEEPEPKVDVVVSEPEPASDSVPMWMIYSALGIGNVILFGLGFLAYRKIMKKDDELEELEEDDEPPAAPAPVAQEAPPIEDDEEDEPPMEDLDPDIVEKAPEPEPELEPEEEPEPAMDMDDPAVLDDLDAMTSEQFQEAEEDLDEGADDDEAGSDTELDDEDEDMVEAMLKAQGLDLAEDELDDAISSLIDDLEEDDDDDR